MSFSWWLAAILTCKSFVILCKRCERLQLVAEREGREEKERKKKRKKEKREKEKKRKRKNNNPKIPPDELSHHDSKNNPAGRNYLAFFSSKVQNLTLFFQLIP